MSYQRPDLPGVFVHEGNAAQRKVTSMPGSGAPGAQTRCCPWPKVARKLGIPLMALFPAIDPALEDASTAREARNPDGLIQQVVRALERRIPHSSA